MRRPRERLEPKDVRRHGRRRAAARRVGDDQAIPAFGPPQQVTELGHRLVLWLLVGPPPERCRGEWEAMHLCHDKTCLHPAHLFWGSRRANLAVGCMDDENSLDVAVKERLELLESVSNLS